MQPPAADQDRAAHEPDSVEDLYENAPCGYLSCFLDGSIARVNATFLDWTGYRRDDLVGRRRFIDLLTPGGRIYHETHYAPLLRMQGSVRAIAMDLVRDDGSRMPVLVNSKLRIGADGEPLAVRTTIFDATDRKKYEAELLAARRRAEQATAWMTSVEDVVARLAAAASVEDVCGVVAEAGSTLFGATSSTVWLTVDGPSGWTPVAGHGPAGRLSVLDEQADLAALRPPHLVQPDELHPVAELVGVRDTLGALALVVPPDRIPGPDELRLLRTLGQQAGQALERAELFDQERTVASTLQQSMLPDRLPDDPRVALSACYRPAVDVMQVGGDWYDAFLLDPDRVALVVGDVVGRGLHAAAAMGQLRSAVRALATLDAGPALLLHRLDAFVDGVPAAQTATLAYGELDLRDGTLVYACAGHLPPVLVDPAGAATQLWGGRSTPLAASFGRGRTEATTRVLPGSRIALYTDGLVEQRDIPLDETIDVLTGVLATTSGRPLDRLSAEVVDEVLGTRPTDDDVCLLVVAYLGAATPASAS